VHRRYVLVGIACAFAAVDLVHKSASNAAYHHARSPLVALGIGALIAGLVVFVPRVPSRAALLGAAIACGGALGNLVSLLVWSQGVPDPIVVHGPTQDVAFNLADVFAVTGDAVLLAAVVLHGLRGRERLHEPV
jgi:lipoprotein signal peptidase